MKMKEFGPPGGVPGAPFRSGNAIRGGSRIPVAEGANPPWGANL